MSVLSLQGAVLQTIELDLALIHQPFRDLPMMREVQPTSVYVNANNAFVSTFGGIVHVLKVLMTS